MSLWEGPAKLLELDDSDQCFLGEVVINIARLEHVKGSEVTQDFELKEGISFTLSGPVTGVLKATVGLRKEILDAEEKARRKAFAVGLGSRVWEKGKAQVWGLGFGKRARRRAFAVGFFSAALDSVTFFWRAGCAAGPYVLSFGRAGICKLCATQDCERRVTSRPRNVFAGGGSAERGRGKESRRR